MQAVKVKDEYITDLEHVHTPKSQAPAAPNILSEALQCASLSDAQEHKELGASCHS